MIVCMAAAIMFPVLTASAAAPMADYAGYKDPALLTRLPNYYLAYATSLKDTQFDYLEFVVKPGGGKDARQRIEGHKTIYFYTFDRAAGNPPSGLQIKRNYQAAATRIGGKIVYEDDSPYMRTTLRVTRNNQETWAEVYTGGVNYYLTIVERQVMKQDVVANAEAFRGGLAESGHVEVPGIFFDFAKSAIKPESEPALREVAKLLSTNPALRVWVVGHTDNVGSAESNMTLSSPRAAAVVAYLTQKLGTDARRLTPHGPGPYAPLATNNTEEGRARNRRVELVAQP
jgi:OOP family OmpA-OmpF porin